MAAEAYASQESSTILLIEADPSLQRLIMLGLQHSGMQVIAARSLEALPTLDMQPPDLLVLDVDAGRMCDWSLLARRWPATARRLRGPMTTKCSGLTPS